MGQEASLSSVRPRRETDDSVSFDSNQAALLPAFRTTTPDPRSPTRSTILDGNRVALSLLTPLSAIIAHPSLQTTTLTPLVQTTDPTMSQPSSLSVLAIAAIVVIGSGAFLLRRHQGTPPSTGSLHSHRNNSNDHDANQPPGTDTVDESAVTDEERVETLIQNHGGRMRQTLIVKETGWSKSKVSMLLTEMAEHDRIKKLRVGRENLISLPGYEPDAARSPYDE